MLLKPACTDVYTHKHDLSLIHTHKQVMVEGKLIKKLKNSHQNIILQFASLIRKTDFNIYL